MSCSDVMAAGEARDGFPVKYLYFNRIRKRGWVESSGPRRQFARLLQYICQNRK